MKRNIQVRHKNYGIGRVVGVLADGTIKVRFDAKTLVALPEHELDIVRRRYFAPVKDAPADIQLPVRKTKRSAAYDFFLPCDVTVPAHGATGIIPTYVKAYMRANEVLTLHIRSSVGIKRGVTLSNATGIIDADYCDNVDNDGNIGIALYNHTDQDVVFKKGECVMQGIFLQYATVDDDDTTAERVGGYGSTDKS